MEERNYLALGQSDRYGRPFTVRAILPNDVAAEARLLRKAYVKLGHVRAPSLVEAQVAAWITYVTQDDNAQLRWVLPVK